MGIGYYAGLLNGGVEDYSNWRFTENGVTNISNEYITTKITDLAIDWIDQQNQPWFCWVAYTAPHTPFHLPPNKMHNQTGLNNNLEDINANPLPYFHAMIESLDYEIGRLIENIPTDELDNTTILFIGDNGTSGRVIQAPFSQGKGTLYQGGIHVPLIVSGKNVTRINAREQSLINSSDLFATIAEMTGIKVPVYENSYSFNSLLTSNQPGKRNYNYSQILDSNKSKSGYTIRNEQFKLIVFEYGNSELYDLNIDPYETTNLMERSFTNTQQTALEELRQKVEELRN
jgi:arylsulfatase A-like enzyme